MVNLSEPTQLAPKFWIGPLPPPGTTLQERGVDVLVLCAKEHQDAALYPGVEVFHCPMSDDGTAPTREEMELAIYTGLRVSRRLAVGKRVLVTCQMGINRSALVSAIALREQTGVSGTAARKHIQALRFGMARGRLFYALQNPFFAAYLDRLGPPPPVRGPRLVSDSAMAAVPW
jgi:hypothetical protein